MWVLYFVLGYFFLVVAIPVCWSLDRVWRRTHASRTVMCPENMIGATIRLDSGYAMRAHVAGNPELRVLTCSRWPGRADCGRECLHAV